MDKIDISKLKIPKVDMSEYKDVVTIVTDLASQNIAAQLNAQIEAASESPKTKLVDCGTKR